MTKIKILRHCSIINFSKDYFRQQYLRAFLELSSDRIFAGVQLSVSSEIPCTQAVLALSLGLFRSQSTVRNFSTAQTDDLSVFASHGRLCFFYRHGCLLASKGREREKKERRERVSLPSEFPSGRRVGFWLCGSGVGFGAVFPSALPLLLFPLLPFWFPPLAAVFTSRGLCGVFVF